MTTLGILMNGITGRVGRKHLEVMGAIQQQGGVELPGGERVQIEPTLLGRDVQKLERLATEFGFATVTTQFEPALQDPQIQVYFDASVPLERPKMILQALEAGKHVYAEKPLTMHSHTALELARAAASRNLKHGLVQNMLFQPGPRKLEHLIKSGFFGRILSARIDFGYWIFEGDWQKAQRPSWNCRLEDGGGLVTDMFPHWNGLLEMLFGRVQAISTLAQTHIPQRFDENQQPYTATADDTFYSLMELEGGITVQINASWAARLYRDDVLQIQIDGTHGSAVAGYHSCKVQHRVNTPRLNAVQGSTSPKDLWQALPDLSGHTDPFKSQWEAFVRSVVAGEPFPWDFFAAARGMQLAEHAWVSSRERRWIDTPLASAP